MDRQEQILNLAKIARISVAYAEDLYDSFFPKPVVSQFVADWYEDHKDILNEAIWEYLVNWDEVVQNDFKRWMYKAYENGAITTLANMHQFGYEVEKETRYTVEVKGIIGYVAYLNQNLNNQEWFFASNEKFKSFRVAHTRKELEEAGFGWVFDCPGVEVKEVTDE
ncbi:DUF1642 domain-containing protein [Streptococcus sp.]|uniref:DUF1642 domain-containing protein n=1 Tax=Streptococcus sp. TaxID=1306 RepID=UPI002913B4D2|nr:DUF1642 domain-containing protein [Streptococcus sp.]MDU3420203.1 DUF1642 domain-containing protein [Streptococcus sp.]